MLEGNTRCFVSYLAQTVFESGPNFSIVQKKPNRCIQKWECRLRGFIKMKVSFSQIVWGWCCAFSNWAYLQKYELLPRSQSLEQHYLFGGFSSCFPFFSLSGNYWTPSKITWPIREGKSMVRLIKWLGKWKGYEQSVPLLSPTQYMTFNLTKVFVIQNASVSFGGKVVGKVCVAFWSLFLLPGLSV